MEGLTDDMSMKNPKIGSVMLTDDHHGLARIRDSHKSVSNQLTSLLSAMRKFIYHFAFMIG